MPEEVGLLLRAMGYPHRTRIYLAGSETFGGQRVLIPLRAMYTYLVDRTSLCSKQELADIFGQETELPPDSFEFPPAKSAKQLKEEWDKAGPRPRPPLPPPPDRPIYWHEKEGWYGWIVEKDSEPDPSLHESREQAHRLLWDAIDYIVTVYANETSHRTPEQYKRSSLPPSAQLDSCCKRTSEQKHSRRWHYARISTSKAKVISLSPPPRMFMYNTQDC